MIDNSVNPFWSPSTSKQSQSGKTTVEVESLRRAAGALHNYIRNVHHSTERLLKMLEDCQQNMESDAYSSKSAEDLKASLNNINNALKNARDIYERIIKKIDEIYESEGILN